jgi:para-aminobenzoate synthetase/4-amino-4-deoxychorismate lyase
VIEARFDDLSAGGESFRLVGPVGVLEATRPDEVAPTLAAAEAAAARGLWVAGCVAYEAAPALDPALAVRTAPAGDPFAAFPLAWFAMFEGREATVLPEPRADAEPSAQDGWRPTSERAAYDTAIDRIHERIAAGDTYQVNHTIRLRSRIEGDARGLYRDLCYAQRSSYAAALDTGRYRILSASPELFFRIDGRRITTRPMKGTAPRGRYPQEDEAIRQALTTSVKDRAENAMIVDLLRNDLGRVARPGTVRWTDVFEPERYETVWQLTSTVSCDLSADADLPGIFRALFPSGSVTGAPKVATMAIIAELEDLPRHAYCGTVGFLAPAGAGAPRARFNVAIRTVVVDAQTSTAEYGVGGGITWDSRAQSEYDEVVAKARVLTARRPRFDLFETMRAEPGEGIRNLDRHLDRLAASAAYFGFPVDRDALAKELKELGARPREHAERVRLVVDPRGRWRVSTTIVPTESGEVRVAVDTTEPVDPSDPLLFHKTTLRRRYEEARARHPDADDVLLTNRRGEVTESTIANVALRLDDRWWTPPLDAGLLPGIGRAIALEEGRLEERPIEIGELGGADELALVSDNRGWRRATLLVEAGDAGPAGV